MFFYYDPKSLKLSNKVATINFITADSGQITPITMRSQEEVLVVTDGMADQEIYGITSREGQVKEVRGVFASLPGHPDEGLMAPEFDQNKTIPLKLAFEVNEGDIPRDAFAIIHGIEHRGAFMVHRMAMKSGDPEFDKRLSAEHGPN